MKKLFYILALALVVGASVSSCTEEVVKPKDNGAVVSGTGIKD